MKTPFLSLFSLLILTASCVESPQEEVNAVNIAEDDSLAIANNFREQEACWNRRDLLCYMQAYDSSEVVQTISRAGVERGYASILKSYQRYFPADKMGTLHFDEFRYKRLSDQYYYIVGRFNLSYAVPDTTFQGWFSVLMEKKNGRWCMISDHSS